MLDLLFAALFVVLGLFYVVTSKLDSNRYLLGFLYFTIAYLALSSYRQGEILSAVESCSVQKEVGQEGTHKDYPED